MSYPIYSVDRKECSISQVHSFSSIKSSLHGVITETPSSDPIVESNRQL